MTITIIRPHSVHPYAERLHLTHREAVRWRPALSRG